MPDTAILSSQPDAPALRSDETKRLGPDEIIRLSRRPLPRHDLNGGHYRRWAAAVVASEVEHAERDARNCVLDLPRIGQVYLYQHLREDVSSYWLEHEVKAVAALKALNRLRRHLDSRHGRSIKDRFEHWLRWDDAARAEWRWQRRILLRDFLGKARGYHAARAAYDAPVARAA